MIVEGPRRTTVGAKTSWQQTHFVAYGWECFGTLRFGKGEDMAELSIF